MREKITARNVLALGDGRYLIERGLYLVVRNGGAARSYVLRYTFGGKRVDLSLGSPAVKPLAVARREADALRLRIATGDDPREERRRQRRQTAPESEPAPGSPTFAEWFDSSVDGILALRRYKSEATGRLYIKMVRRDAFPAFGQVRLDALDVADVLRCLRPIWESKTRTASMLRGFLEIVFTHARSQGLMTRPNPATWRGGLDAYLPAPAKVHATEHRRAATVDQARDILHMCLDPSKVQNIALRCLAAIILTASRTNEMVGLRWAEVDFERGIISIPPERRKDGRDYPHRVPIATQLAAILGGLPRLGEYVFASDKAKYRSPIDQNSPGNALRGLGAGMPTVHGFRSTFRDWAAETGVDEVVAEKALMHATGTATARAYQRSDLLELRRPVMQAWADALL